MLRSASHVFRPKSVAGRPGCGPSPPREPVPAFEVDTAGAFSNELRAHLEAIERKLDEVVSRLDHGLGAPRQPREVQVPPLSPAVPQATASPLVAWQAPAPGGTDAKAPVIVRNSRRTKSLEAANKVMLDMTADLSEMREMSAMPGSMSVHLSEWDGAAQEEEEEPSSSRTVMEDAAQEAPVRKEESLESSTRGEAAAPQSRESEYSEDDIVQGGIRKGGSPTSPQAVRLGAFSTRMVWGGDDRSTVVHSFSQELEEKKDTRLWQFVHGVPFQLVTSLVIMLNALFVGVRVDQGLRRAVRGEPEHVVMGYIELAFIVFFAGELLLRVVAEGKLFLVGPEWRWNFFDTLLVAFSIADVAMNGLTTQEDGGVGSVTTSRVAALGRWIRIVRFMRVIRIGRAVRAFHRLRVVVFAIFASIVSLLWCFVVLFLIIYIFAVFFLHGLVEHAGEHSEEYAKDPDAGNLAELLLLYNGVTRAMVTLFMAITGGVDWRDAMLPLKSMHWLYEPVFNFYVFFMVTGVMNVVVGAFVATTAEITAKDRELLVKAEMSRLDSYRRKIKTFFTEADTDRSGKLSWAEFKQHLKVPKVSAYFRALELDVSQAHVVFKLLDRDGSSEVSLEEFLAGCLRLKGQAKSLDVNMLLYENRRLYKRLTEFMQLASEALFTDGQLGQRSQSRARQDGPTPPSLEGSPQGSPRQTMT